MISATRSSAGAARGLPDRRRPAQHPAGRRTPAGSRIRAISSARRAGGGVASSQARPGRITSAPISWAMPRPSMAAGRSPCGPGRRRPVSHRPGCPPVAGPSAPAPAGVPALLPGPARDAAASQSSTFSRASLRVVPVPGRPRQANGGASSRPRPPLAGPRVAATRRDRARREPRQQRQRPRR